MSWLKSTQDDDWLADDTPTINSAEAIRSDDAAGSSIVDLAASHPQFEPIHALPDAPKCSIRMYSFLNTHNSQI